MSVLGTEYQDRALSDIIARSFIWSEIANDTGDEQLSKKLFGLTTSLANMSDADWKKEYYTINKQDLYPLRFIDDIRFLQSDLQEVYKQKNTLINKIQSYLSKIVNFNDDLYKIYAIYEKQPKEKAFNLKSLSYYAGSIEAKINLNSANY